MVKASERRLRKGVKTLWSCETLTASSPQYDAWAKAESDGKAPVVSNEIILLSISDLQCAHIWKRLTHDPWAYRHIILCPASSFEHKNALWTLLTLLPKRCPHTTVWWFPRCQATGRTLNLSWMTHTLTALRAVGAWNDPDVASALRVVLHRPLFLCHNRTGGASCPDSQEDWLLTADVYEAVCSTGVVMLTLVGGVAVHAGVRCIVSEQAWVAQGFCAISYVAIFFFMPLWCLRRAWRAKAQGATDSAMSVCSRVARAVILVAWVIVLLLSIVLKMGRLGEWNMYTLITQHRKWARILRRLVNTCVGAIVSLVRCMMAILLSKR